MSKVVLGSLLAGIVALGTHAGAETAVRVWEGTETIPTYEEGPPDTNPPFDLFTSVRYNYPYTMRLALTDRRAPRVWRTLNLENEQLRVSVLPDLGGRLWRCVDKANGAQMFYANPSLKFAQVAYRGAWATFGIEFNFPVSHNWVTSSPVDFATLENPDGSASIVVGNTDLVYGMRWRVRLTLHPGRGVLEQGTTLYNRSDLRHRFYWWTNAAVESWDDSMLIYPMELTASHGFTHVDTWPVSSAGVDLTRPGNHLQGPVSLFSHGSREGFMGVYHPRTRSGVAHYAEPEELPAKKVWSWGADADGLDWRKALSDNESAEVEIQAGLFRNQETYGFLEPQETIRFTEHWLPVREIGGFSRANPEAVLHVSRSREGSGDGVLRVGLNVTRPLTDGRLRVEDGDRVVAEERLDLEPSGALQKAFPELSGDGPYTVKVLTSRGSPLIVHTEGLYDTVPRAEVELGPQEVHRIPPPAARTDGDFLEQGTSEEREGKLLVAYATYEDGLERFPGSFALHKAAGRLAVQLKRFEEARSRLSVARRRVTNDAETRYYLGEALRALGEPKKARTEWEAALRSRATRPAALLQLARLLAREGDAPGALERVRRALREDPRMVRAGAFEVILLRRAGRLEEARNRLGAWRREDPASSTLRNEAVKLGDDDPALWRHLAGDPQRVLELAIDYMELGAWDDALELLEREYPVGEGVFPEPGMPAPQRHPELAYYRGFCRERLGEPGRVDFEAASRMPTTYVFPHRSESLPVLRRALEVDPEDATARFLLGSLYLSGGMVERAVEEWQIVRGQRAAMPVLHRNLGLALFLGQQRTDAAAEVLIEGLEADPRNVEVYQVLDQVLGILGRSGEERARVLARYPDAESMPASLVFPLALALVEAGRFGEAEKLFVGRFFPRAEFGTNVRQAYVEVRLQHALSHAREGRCGEAREILKGLGEPVPGLPFTRDGLAAFVDAARVQYLVGEGLALCGQEAAALDHWERAAAATDDYPHPSLAFAHRAALRIGEERAEALRSQLEAALQSWANRLVVGTSFPGPNACGQGLMLRELGREDEAVAKLRSALLQPDRLLSHYVARAELARAP